MNWDQIQGQWRQVLGQVQMNWGRLTNDDMEQIDGNRERLAGKLQERYGFEKDQAQREIDSWLARQ